LLPVFEQICSFALQSLTVEARIPFHQTVQW